MDDRLAFLDSLPVTNWEAEDGGGDLSEPPDIVHDAERAATAFDRSLSA